MTSLPGRLAAVVLGSLAMTASSASAATWSPPENLSRAHLFVDAPRIQVSGDATVLVTWSWQEGIGDEAIIGVDSAARGPAGTAFAPEQAIVSARPVGRAQFISGPVLYGRRRAVLASSRAATNDPGDPRVRLAVRFGGTDGGFGPSRVLQVARGITNVELAANARGDAAVAWYEDRGVRIDRVYVGVRSAGGRFGAPVRLATGRIRGASVAVGARGDVLVAWDARGTVRTRLRPAGRRSFRATDTIRSQDAFNADLRTAVARNGRAIVAWGAQFTSEGGSAGPVFQQAAVRPAGGDRFRPAQLLERHAGTRFGGSIDLLGDVGGRSVVAWTGFDGVTGRVRASATDASGRFAVAQDVSPAGQQAAVSDLAAGPDGELLVVWDNGGFDANQVQAAFAPPGLAFGPPEPVSPAQEAGDGRGAFDPRTGVPTVVWTNRPQGSQRPLRDIESFAQAATRRG
jgi:hypothetical protein